MYQSLLLLLPNCSSIVAPLHLKSLRQSIAVAPCSSSPLQLHLQLTTAAAAPSVLLQFTTAAAQPAAPAAHHRCCSTCSSPPLLSLLLFLSCSATVSPLLPHLQLHCSTHRCSTCSSLALVAAASIHCINPCCCCSPAAAPLSLPYCCHLRCHYLPLSPLPSCSATASSSLLLYLQLHFISNPCGNPLLLLLAAHHRCSPSPKTWLQHLQLYSPAISCAAAATTQPHTSTR